MSDDPKFTAVLAAIDAANEADPFTITIDGIERPKEQTHAEMMTEWVQRLDPSATDLQLIAARAHHVRRWTILRSEYPEGRNGYLRWRTALKKVHAETVAEAMSAAGYEAADIERVQAIVQKKNLRSDPDVQTHEDALCLVFVATQFDELASRFDRDKMIDIVAKTLAKMSERGIEAALGLDLSEADRDLILAAAAAPKAQPGSSSR